MTFTEETRKQFDQWSVPQLVIKYAQLNKKEFSLPNEEELMELLDVIVDRRVYETGGPPGIEGTSKKAIGDLIMLPDRFQHIYREQPYTTTQFMQTQQIIDLLGSQFFSTRNLQKIVDHKTAKEINENFREVQSLDIERLERKLDTGKPSGFIENLYTYEIELQLYFIQRANITNPNNKYPLWIAEKQGKTDHLSFKIKNEIATHLPHLQEGDLTTLDPTMLIAYYFKEDDAYNLPGFSDALKQIPESERDFIERIKAWRNEQNDDHPKLAKPEEQRLKRITNNLKPYVQRLPREEQESMLEHTVLSFGDINDMRGIKIVLPDNAEFDHYINLLVNHPSYYQEEELEIHDGTKRRKTSYRAAHGWILSDRFDKEDPRQALYSVAERKEIHILNLTTGIIDLLGKDNGWAYHQRQQREKYGHFNNQQKAVADFALKRLFAVAHGITEPFKEVLKERKSEFFTEKKYYQVLRQQAKEALDNLREAIH